LNESFFSAPQLKRDPLGCASNNVTRRIWLILLVLAGCVGGERRPVVIHADTVTPEPPADTADTMVDPGGFYFLTDSVPPWAADIDVLELTGLYFISVPHDTTITPPDTAKFLYHILLKSDTGGPPPPDFHLTQLVFHGRHFKFVTAAMDSVSYDFDGYFRRFSKLRPEDVALSGRLRKLRAGRTVAEGDVRFRYFEGE